MLPPDANPNQDQVFGTSRREREQCMVYTLHTVNHTLCTLYTSQYALCTVNTVHFDHSHCSYTLCECAAQRAL